MINRPSAINRAEVVLDSGERFPLELLEDMGAGALETFKSRNGLIIAKAAARAVVKSTASAVAARAVRETSGEGAGLLTGLAGLLFTQASERADIRLSRFFPRYALVGGINLPPGNYSVTVNFYGTRGLISSQRQEIAVQPNRLNLLEFVSLE